MVTTIHGDLDERLLVKTTGVDCTDDAQVEWVEYRLRALNVKEENELHALGVQLLPRHIPVNPDEIVHRSAHVTIKKGFVAQALGNL